MMFWISSAMPLQGTTLQSEATLEELHGFPQRYTMPQERCEPGMPCKPQPSCSVL